MDYNGSFAMLTDITEMKSVELALRDSEERYRLIVETAAEGIIILDKMVWWLMLIIRYWRLVS